MCFMGDEGDAGNTVTVIVVRERTTKMTMAAAMPDKSSGTHIAKRIAAFMKEVGVGLGDVVIKTDQEPAIKAIMEEAGRVRAAGGGGKYIMEESPVGSSASNGVVERAIQSVQGQVRVMKDALEAKWGVKLGAKHSVVPWMIEYAAVLLNRFEVGKDGKTAYERSKGRSSKTLGVEFGEAVLWKRKPVGGALGKFTCFWEDGVYLGLRASSGEMTIGDERGVWRTDVAAETVGGQMEQQERRDGQVGSVS